MPSGATRAGNLCRWGGEFTYGTTVWEGFNQDQGKLDIDLNGRSEIALTKETHDSISRRAAGLDAFSVDTIL